MPSLLPGYESRQHDEDPRSAKSGTGYDIFISYRHNDNRSGWVTEFVEHLEEELAATLKEPLSIYFDKNPHDGLLETYNVDKSLEGKLKCLIFIPIISQTYCDSKSFAWQHEFVAFNRLAQEDEIGRDIRLSNGNVASRILPVKIHKLDSEDTATIENETGGLLRAVEFIYKEPGVNRPLKITDKKEDNQNHTDYHNQINKVAHAIKELIYAYKGLPLSYETVSQQHRQLEPNDKGIIVLPFVNISNDPDQEYFSDGLTEELITELSRLNNLLVISRSSAMTFKNSSKKISEITKEVSVRYVLEGSVRKAGDKLRITAQLIDAKTDTHLWAENFNGQLQEIFDIQEKVSRAIARELEIKLSLYENEILRQRPINNGIAFDYYLRARRELIGWNEAAFNRALKLLQNALDLTGPNAVLYAGMAYVYWNYANIGIRAEESDKLAEDYINMAFRIDPDNPDANLVLGLLFQAFRGQPKKANHYFRKVLKSRLNDFDATMWIFVSYFTFGKADSIILAQKMQLIDPLATVSICAPGFIEMYKGNYDAALPYISKGCQMEPENFFYSLFNIVALACKGQKEEALSFLMNGSFYQQQSSIGQTFQLFKAILSNDPAIDTFLTSDIELFKRDFQIAHVIAQMFSMAGRKDKTYEWLESAMHSGFCNYPLLSRQDPINHLLKGEPRFEQILEKIKTMWEDFD